MVKIVEDLDFELTKYLVGRTKNGQTTFEACNYDSLVSRVVKYFEGNLDSLKVIRVLPKPPYFGDVDDNKLRKIYDLYILRLEKKVTFH